MANVTPGGMIAVKHQWPSEPTYWDGKQKGFYNLRGTNVKRASGSESR